MTALAAASIAADPQAALVERWRRIIEGEEVPPPVRRIPETEAWIAEKERQGGFAFTEEDKGRIRVAEAALRDHPGEWVVWMETPAGPAILGAGLDQYQALYRLFWPKFNTLLHVAYPPDLVEVETVR